MRAARLPPLARHLGWKEIFSADARAELVRLDRSAEFDPVSFYGPRYAETEGADALARLQDVDLGIYLVDDLLVKTDRASMAHSLETRVPFLDNVVAELALSLPPRHRVLGFSKKRLLRRAVAPLLPRSIVHGKKQGFSIPLASWLRGELEPFARDTLATETIERQGFFDPAAVQRLLAAHVEGREDFSRQLWGLLDVHVLVRPLRSRAGRGLRGSPDALQRLRSGRGSGGARVPLRRRGRLDAGPDDRGARAPDRRHRLPQPAGAARGPDAQARRRRRPGGGAGRGTAVPAVGRPDPRRSWAAHW